MRFLIKLIAILVVLAALVYTAGILLPEAHTASRSITLNQPPATVWKVITDYKSMPEWSKDIQSATQQQNKNGHQVWRFDDKRGHYMVLEDIEKHKPTKLVSRIVETDYPFSGEWVFDLKPGEAENTTELTITENGALTNPLCRVMAKYILGYDMGIKKYQEALGERISKPNPNTTVKE